MAKRTRNSSNSSRPRPGNAIRLLALGAIAIAAVGCGKTRTLTLTPSDPAAAELVPSPALQANAYKKILLLPMEANVETQQLEIGTVATKDGQFYVSKIEKALLSEGFDVISPEIVARAKNRGKMSAAEKAMVMGKETKADAVFIPQSVTVIGTQTFYKVTKSKAVAVEPGRVKEDKKKGFIDSESEDCLYRLPHYEVRFEGKLIDARTGNVLWVGSGRQTTVDAFSGSWVAKLDKKCRLVEENFIYEDYLQSEETLGRTVSGLLTRMLDPMKKAALAGKPIVDKVVKKKPPKKPEPKKPEPKKKKIAIVSSKRASLRAGPGNRNQRIRWVPRKAKMEILETMGTWHKVMLQDGTQGWMYDGSLIIQD